MFRLSIALATTIYLGDVCADLFLSPLGSRHLGTVQNIDAFTIYMRRFFRFRQQRASQPDASPVASCGEPTVSEISNKIELTWKNF